jgi:hypothetical protein
LQWVDGCKKVVTKFWVSTTIITESMKNRLKLCHHILYAFCYFRFPDCVLLYSEKQRQTLHELQLMGISSAGNHLMLPSQHELMFILQTLWMQFNAIQTSQNQCQHLWRVFFQDVQVCTGLSQPATRCEVSTQSRYASCF